MMKLENIQLLFVAFLFIGCSRQSDPPRLGGWDYFWMDNVKKTK